MVQPTHGNYRGYYSKRPFVTDPRLSLLDPSLFVGATVLDVGCNEGWVTCEIAQQWHAKKVVGVDIDADLILAAWRRRRAVWSAQAPEPKSTGKRMIHNDTENVPMTQSGHFPLALAHMYGPLSIPSSTPMTQFVFPHNVVFHTADWVTHGVPEDPAGYDVILAFSISKWIHLNDGDEGLLAFFRRVASVLRPGGTFILEPQAWETYAKARRMHPKLRETASTLQLQPDAFPEIIEGLGFMPCKCAGMTGKGGFHRPVDVYIKK